VDQEQSKDLSSNAKAFQVHIATKASRIQLSMQEKNKSFLVDQEQARI
jgi:hypothetical protein